MKRWTYGANGTHRNAFVRVEKAPWWAFWIEDAVGMVCHAMHIIPFFCSWITTDWFHLYVHSPVSHWVEQKSQVAYIHVEYEHLKERMLPFDPKYWEEQIQFDQEDSDG